MANAFQLDTLNGKFFLLPESYHPGEPAPGRVLSNDDGPRSTAPRRIQFHMRSSSMAAFRTKAAFIAAGYLASVT